VQQWEYLEFKVDLEHRQWRGGVNNSEGKLAGANSQALLNELGAQGWELAGVGGDTDFVYRLFFKRPKE
jgi:hypothetical protein